MNHEFNGMDPFADFYAQNDRLESPEPVVVAPKKVEAHNGNPHCDRTHADGTKWVDYASNYSLPELDNIGWMRVELFHNKPGSGLTEWVLKFIINECDTPDQVNTSKSTRNVVFKMFHGRKLDEAVKNCHENDSFMDRFMDKVNTQSYRHKAAKMLRPPKQKKTNHPIDKVVAGFCYVQKKPWGTVTFPHQQAIILPAPHETGDYEAVLSLHINERNIDTIILRDVRNHIPAGKTARDPKAAVMVGYMDKVGFNEWKKGVKDEQ